MDLKPPTESLVCTGCLSAAGARSPAIRPPGGTTRQVGVGCPAARASRCAWSAARPTMRSGAGPGLALRVLLLLAPAVLTTAGCSEYIDDLYGRRRGPGASASVNGTAVLASMFEQAGHKVSTWWAISPRLESADCIVWFPDDFAPPSREVRQHLENWLTQRPGRTLIYVGRDFDAALWYWNHVLPQMPPGQRKEAARRRSYARQRFFARRSTIPKQEDCGWFTITGKYRPRKVRTLQGEPRWLKGIDPSKVEIELYSRIDRPRKVGQTAVSPQQIEVLLSSEDDLLVMRQPWYVYEPDDYWDLWGSPDTWEEAPEQVPADSWEPAPSSSEWPPSQLELGPPSTEGRTVVRVDPETGELVVIEPGQGERQTGESGGSWQREPIGESQLIVVANGSFLLNLMLVNHEHRKLAGKLIAEVERGGGLGQRVIFLESGPGGPPIRPRDPVQPGPSGLEALLNWPTWWLFAHLAFAGILLMLSRWPIFGVPRELPAENQTDFGQHVEALAELLERTGDRTFAVSRVVHYRQTVCGEMRPASRRR